MKRLIVVLALALAGCGGTQATETPTPTPSPTPAHDYVAECKAGLERNLERNLDYGTKPKAPAVCHRLDRATFNRLVDEVAEEYQP